MGPAYLTDWINGDHYTGSVTSPCAVSGYPHLTVPAGQVTGLPWGLSFLGPAWSEAKLLAYGHPFERATAGGCASAHRGLRGGRLSGARRPRF
jgi:amidase